MKAENLKSKKKKKRSKSPAWEFKIPSLENDAEKNCQINAEEETFKGEEVIVRRTLFKTSTLEKNSEKNCQIDGVQETAKNGEDIEKRTLSKTQPFETNSEKNCQIDGVEETTENGEAIVRPILHEILTKLPLFKSTQNNTELKEKAYSCDKCDFSFSPENHLKLHTQQREQRTRT